MENKIVFEGPDELHLLTFDLLEFFCLCVFVSLDTILIGRSVLPLYARVKTFIYVNILKYFFSLCTFEA